jgi:hypothetical protein
MLHIVLASFPPFRENETTYMPTTHKKVTHAKSNSVIGRYKDA